MARKAWIVIGAVVAAAVVTGAIGVVGMATHDGDTVAGGPRAVLDGQQQSNGQWNQGNDNGGGMPFGQREGSGTGQGGGTGEHNRTASLQDGDDGWNPVFGLPWLAAGLLIGLGVTMLVWQPWKQPALATAGTTSTAPSGSTPGGPESLDVSQQWAQWHRDVHAAEETTQDMATREMTASPAGTETSAPVEPTSAVKTDDSPVAEGQAGGHPGADAAAPADEEDKD